MDLRSPNIYVRSTGSVRGRGVYSARAHAAGETVEECPVILFSAPFAQVPDEVRKVLFNWSVLADVTHAHALALGFGSIYNHENPSNLRYEADAEAGLLRFVALRVIAPHEELTINYDFGTGTGSHDAADERDWFTRMGMKDQATD